VLPEGLVVGEDPAADAARFERTEGGVVLITRAMLARL
jgi:glucose-1-phosphate adenylyltransferase